MKNKINYKQIIAGISRTILGLVFIFSGFVKAVDPLGTVYKIEDYLNAFGGFFVELVPYANIAAVSMIALEFILGVCMVFNVRTRWTSWLALVFYLVMTPLTWYIAKENPVSDCGCFGDAIVISNWQTFYKNLVLLTLAVLLVIWRKHTYQLWSGIVELCIILAAVGIVGGLMGYAHTHLPILDFRPYKIGNNIPKLMEWPEGAEQDQYEYSFVYSKDGVEQSFTLENYPAEDTTWTFVRQESKLIKKGYEPPIHDFSITTNEGDDITDWVLESTKPVTLVVMYDLNKKDTEQMHKVVALQKNCAEKDEECYILTGSHSLDIEAFCKEYPTLATSICTCDPVTLKTIVRANPGVIVIKEGTIIDKYNVRNR